MAVSIALSVCQRVVAAVFGGYALANLLPLALAGLLPIGRAESVMAALLLSFAVYTAAILWAFAARSAGWAWAGVLVPAVLAGVLLAVQRAWS
ncbi:DUF3649 domain-containing protein [Thauera butanivorans]|jgi:hypothetical protein